MNYHVAKKHSARSATTVHICKISHSDFRSVYIQRRHSEGHMANREDQELKLLMLQTMEEVDGKNLTEQLQTCRLFLVTSEMENGRPRAFNFAMITLDPTFLFGSLKCAAKLN